MWVGRWRTGTIVETHVPVEIPKVVGICHTLCDNLLGFELFGERLLAIGPEKIIRMGKCCDEPSEQHGESPS
jgi:hypothetical protein